MNMRMNYKIIIIILYLLVSPDLMAQIQKKDTAIEKSVQMAEVVVKGRNVYSKATTLYYCFPKTTVISELMHWMQYRL